MLNVQIHSDHVDNGMATVLTKHGKDLLCLIRTHEIIDKNPLDVLDTLLNHFGIIRAAILTKKELQYVYRYVSAFLDFLCQILTDDLTVKILAELILQDSPSVLSL